MRGHRIVLVILAALMAGLATGCGSLAAASELSTKLSAEGFREPNVQLASRDGEDVIQVTAKSHPTLRGRQALERVAELVWNTVPRRFDRLQIAIGSETPGAITHDKLSEALGPRDPKLDERSIGGDLAAPLIWVGVGVFVLLAGSIITVLVVVRRSRRNQVPPGPSTGWRPPPGPPHRPGYPGPPPPPQGRAMPPGQPRPPIR